MTIVLLLVGLGLIVLGADWLVEGASSIARKAGVSEFVIGLTIVGFGTSCPELVVSLTGAFAGNADIAVGNVLGSNIFNVLFILGLTALLRPVSMTRENRKSDIPRDISSIFLSTFNHGNQTQIGPYCQGPRHICRRSGRWHRPLFRQRWTGCRNRHLWPSAPVFLQDWTQARG
ncbi:MAG: sodium:calcium antiporter [Bacteroidales bacterium]|nr:sodium:calcium antiporter [Bacteroidales bacterium]